MQRTQVYLTSAQHRSLLREARAANLSMTEVLRRMIDQHFSGRKGLHAFAKEEVMRFVGLGASGESDTAENHDRVLGESLRATSIR